MVEECSLISLNHVTPLAAALGDAAEVEEEVGGCIYRADLNNTDQ